MNKKLFLLPILSLSLLAGCAGKPANPSTSQSGSQSQSQSGSGSQGQKEIWEEDEVEGESTIAQVKAAEAGSYFKVRGTVVANSGSTLAIYRKGQFLYCYNFKAEDNDNIAEHPLGSYVEIYAKSDKYEGSTQLSAYFDSAYDTNAKLTVLQAKGETVAPVKVSTAEQLTNAYGGGMLMEVEFIAGSGKTFSATEKNSNQDLAGYIGDNDFTIRLEKYLPDAVKAALLEANAAEIEDHATYKMVVLGAATSSGNVRGLLVEGSSWSKTKEAVFADPTAVILESKDDVHEVVVDKTLTLDWLVLPKTAKQEVTWTSSDETKATVKDGVITGVAATSDPVTITAATTAKPSVKETFEITVSEPVDAPVALPAEGLTLDVAAIKADKGDLGSNSYKDAVELTRGATGIKYTASNNKNLTFANGAYTASGAIGEDCFQAKANTGVFLSIDSRIVSATTITLTMYATYAEEGTDNLPTVKVGAGNAISPNELDKGKMQPTADLGVKVGDYEAYKYVLTYTVSVENASISFSSAKVGAVRFSSIVIK